MKTETISSHMPNVGASNETSDSIPSLIEQVVNQKRALLQKTKEGRFRGVNLLKEAVYITSDVSTAGFSVVQGVSLVTTVSSALQMIGSISGITGGILNIGQGFFLLTEAAQYLQNKQYKQFSRILADALLLIGIGAIMLLISLSKIGVKIGGVASLAANPYLMPILILLLVLPGLIQTVNHLVRVQKGKDLAAQLKVGEPFLNGKETLLENRSPFKMFAELDSANREQSLKTISHVMEQFSDEMGVEAAIESLEFMRRILAEETEEKIEEQRLICQETIKAYNRMVALRAFQLTLYGLTFPLGLASSLVSNGAAKVVNAVSKFCLTAPSSVGAYMDTMEPFKRNGAIAVPKVLI